jgi:hypothetical protein
MDSADIDAAVIAALKADTQLAALMPDGVYFGIAKPGSTRFVVVALFDSLDDDVFGGRGIEGNLYAVQAVGLGSVVTLANMRAAAKRIDVVLGDGTFPVTGYALMASYRDEPGRIVRSDPDPLDASMIWHHYGANYRVEVTRP